MSASDANSAIYISDTPAQIKNKIKKHAFSGGGDTAALHAENGGNCDVDVAFQYLRFFLDDDAELKSIRVAYTAGTMSTMELKERCVDVVSALVKTMQDVFLFNVEP
jgi:tryptophanyl-tRNA synthetase